MTKPRGEGPRDEHRAALRHPEASFSHTMPGLMRTLTMRPWMAVAAFVMGLGPGLEPAARGVTTPIAAQPHLAGSLPVVEQAILDGLRRAGLAGNLIRIAADTNGRFTAAAVVFTYEDGGGAALARLQDDAWKVATTALAAAPTIDELDLTAVPGSGAWTGGLPGEATFTAAVTPEDLSRLPAGVSASEAFSLLPRVWVDPALLAGAAGRPPRPSAEPRAAPPSGHRREPGPTFSGSMAEHTAEAVHRSLGQSAGILVGGTLYRGNPLSPRVALTFDDGPEPLYTPLLLDTLDRIGVKATFFLVGKRVRQYPYFAREIARRGHELGNHTFHHRNLTRLSEQEVRNELESAQQVIEQVTGIRPMFFRPPGGDYNTTVLRAARDLGLITVFWTDDPGDYVRLPGKLLKRVLLARVDNGGIVLLHQGVPETVAILPQAIAILRRKHFVVSTVGEIIAGLR